MWGAGIGLDFNLKDGESRAFENRGPWMPGRQPIGFEFDLEFPGGAGDASTLLVEFPIYFPNKEVRLDGHSGALLRNGTIIKSDGSIIKPDGSIVNPDGSILENDGTVVETSDSNRIVKTDDGRELTAGGEFKLPKPSTSDEHPFGSPFWRRPDDDFSSESLAKKGHNKVFLACTGNANCTGGGVLPPPGEGDKSNYDFDSTQILGIQFHVRTSRDKATSYYFCISNLAVFYH